MSVLDLHPEAVYWHDSKQTLSINIYRIGGSQSHTWGLAINWPINFFLTTNGSHDFSNLIRSVFDTRYSWKHSSLWRISQTWVSFVTTVRLVSEPEDRHYFLNNFSSLNLNLGSKICTIFIILLMSGARHIFCLSVLMLICVKSKKQMLILLLFSNIMPPKKKNSKKNIAKERTF